MMIQSLLYKERQCSAFLTKTLKIKFYILLPQLEDTLSIVWVQTMPREKSKLLQNYYQAKAASDRV